MSGRHMAFPFHIGVDGRSATPASIDAHIKGEIVQLLLTTPGERPFMPDFGGGLKRLVFEANDEITAGIAKATVSQALSFWLQQRVQVLALNVENDNSTLNVDLQYRIIISGEEKQLRFQHSI